MVSLEEHVKKFGKGYFEEDAFCGYKGYTWKLVQKFLIPRFKKVKEFQPHSVLDVGCAYGFSIEYMRDHLNMMAHGCDVSPWAVSQVKGTARGHVQVQNVVKLSYKTEAFDFVTCFDVLEHIPEENVDAAIYELFRVARKYVMVAIAGQTNDTDKTHVCLKPEAWWMEKLTKWGTVECRFGECIILKVSKE